MAADPRQFTEHNEVGGVNVYLEDKRMSELKSATGKTASQISTADEYIPLQDTDGNLVKINPASFQEAVRNVLGSLLANNDKGTTISGIPALSGSGASLDFGSVTPANLASVLGVPSYNRNINDFSNSFKQDILSSFNSASDLSNFDGTSTSGGEGRWFGFRHSNHTGAAIVIYGWGIYLAEINSTNVNSWLIVINQS